jgi:hypothetical protein
VREHDAREKDFIILGDMNIQSAQELAEATPEGFVSLNDECVPTTTSPKSPRPYDHVMFRPHCTRKMDLAYDIKVVDLVNAMRGLWTSAAPCPGDPYEHDAFRQHFSDHRPALRIPSEDDDP